MKNVNRMLMIFILVGVVLVTGCTEQFSVKQDKIGTNVTDIIPTVKYGPEIIEAFDSQEEVRVIVRMRENPNTTTTTEERSAFLIRIDLVLSELSDDEFKLVRKYWDGFSGIITRKGFDKLINNTEINEIYFDTIGSTIFDEN